MESNRRRFLAALAAGVTGTLAGCGGDGGSGTPTETATDTPTATATPTPETTATPTPEPTATETDTPTAAETDTPTAAETDTPTVTATDTATGTVDLAINNDGLQAWLVESDSSGAVAETGTENPTMTFEVGTRYSVENRGWDFHPFALRAGDDTPLLSQSADGRFEDDADVAWTDDGETFAFTFTDELASAVDYYICTVHSSMRGDVVSA